jgi:signal transduction histidine kinase
MGGALFILLISALFGIIWAQRLTRPIEVICDAAERVRRGDFEIHLESTSRDEIGTLSTSFNNMVSELKAREKSLKEAHAKLIQSEKMSAFGQIGAGIAHEVKNPLAGILGMTQLSLRKVPSESPLHANLKTIEKETKRCKDIIDNLLKFARSEKTDFKSIKVNSVLNDAVSIVQHQLGINQVSLEISLGEGLPNILGNANQLQQVFMNLLINSQQAMNGKPGLIKLLSRTASPDMIQVSVSDNGPGIPKDIQNKIFEPFFTTKPAGVGTGLGLSVSYGIIKDHNGDIRVQSTQGKGCTFTVLLPIVSMTATASGPALQRAAS